MTTLYTRVLELSLLYEVWEIFMFERDKFFIFYFAVGLILTRRNEILALKSIDRILRVMPNLKIESYAELAEVYSNTLLVRRNTPVSF